MGTEIHSAIDFYERHPISCEIILNKLSAARGHLNDLNPDELFPHDQDHYGGLAANDALAERADIGKGTRIVDFCAGLGGPSRYFAHRYGADVTGIELTPARVKGAEELTRRVGLTITNQNQYIMWRHVSVYKSSARTCNSPCFVSAISIRPAKDMPG